MGGATVLGAVILILTGAVYVGGMWPLSYEYHHWIPTTGTVQTVDSRIIPSGDSVTQRIVLKFTDGRIRAIDDTSALTLKEGDPVSLKCKRAYDFGVPRETHGWTCKWAGVRN